jgi:hypothetical protein
VPFTVKRRGAWAATAVEPPSAGPMEDMKLVSMKTEKGIMEDMLVSMKTWEDMKIVLDVLRPP